METFYQPICLGVVFAFLIPNLDKNAVPRSDKSSAGTPCRLTMFFDNNSAMISEVWSDVANTSGHFVK